MRASEHAQGCHGTPSGHSRDFWPTFCLPLYTVTQEVHSEPVGKAGVTSDDVSGPRAALGSLVILRTQHHQPAVASRGA